MDVVRVGPTPHVDILTLTRRYGVVLEHLDANAPLPGSYWGDDEAGLRGNELFVRANTPLHSLLHELSHYVCMSAARRSGLDRDAGGDDDEESAVCYLQILLADQLSGLGRNRVLEDMDAWGYSFRLGSAREWFERDATDACNWLRRHGVVDDNQQPTFQLVK